MSTNCAVPGCVKPVAFRGVCASHYLKRHTDEVAPYLAADARGKPRGVRRKRAAGEAPTEGVAAATPTTRRPPAPTTPSAPDDGRIAVRVSLEAAEAILEDVVRTVRSRATALAGTEPSQGGDAFEALVTVVLGYADLRQQVRAAKL